MAGEGQRTSLDSAGSPLGEGEAHGSGSVERVLEGCADRHASAADLNELSLGGDAESGVGLACVGDVRQRGAHRLAVGGCPPVGLVVGGAPPGLLGGLTVCGEPLELLALKLVVAEVGGSQRACTRRRQVKVQPPAATAAVQLSTPSLTRTVPVASRRPAR